MKQLKTSGGYTLKRFKIAGLTLSEALYPPKLYQARHTHEPASLSIVVEGGYVETFAKNHRACEPSMIIFHPPEETHAVRFGTAEVRILSVIINRQRLEYVREHSPVLDSPAICRTDTFARLGTRIYREFQRADAASALSIEGLVFEILAEASRAAHKEKPRAARRGSNGREIFCAPISPKPLISKPSPARSACIRFIWRAFFARNTAARSANTSAVCASNSPPGKSPIPPPRSTKSRSPPVFPTRAILIKLSKPPTI